MMCKKFKIVLEIISLVLLLGGIVINGNNVSAARNITEVQSSIVDKAIMQGVYNCYNNGFVKSNIPTLENFNGVKSIIDNSKSQGENDVPLVTGIGSMSFWGTNRYSIKDSGLSCDQLFSGGTYSFGGYSDGVLEAMKKTVPDKSRAEEVITFMNNMGYDTATTGTVACYNLIYNGSQSTNSICLNSDGTLSENENMQQNYKEEVKLSVRGNNQVCLTIKTTSLATTPNEDFGCKTLANPNDFSSEWLAGVPNRESTLTNSDNCAHAKCEITLRLGQGDNIKKTYSFSPSGGPVDSMAATSAKFRGNNSAIAAFGAINYLSSPNTYSTESDLRFTDLEKRVLYQAYLQSVYGITPDCGVEEWNRGSYDQSVQWFDGSGTTKTCYFSKSDAKNTNAAVNGVDNNGFLSYESIRRNGSTTAFDNLLNEFGALRTEYTSQEVADFNESVANSTTGGMEGQQPSSEANCFNSGAAGALGWVLCPILDMLSSAAGSLYEKMIMPNLQIEPILFNQSSASGTKQAWDIFQRIANVLIIALFLVVIFSQLTGVGIDNYGIKRILPKIILVAILMNLSYYICLIFIDISNIAGNGIQAIFNSLPANIENSNFSSIEGMSSTIVSVALVGSISTIAGFAGVFSVATLFALLPTVVSVVVSIFFLFLILSVRQAAVVVFVVISPLAFVCYMLPNTKKWFDRWVKIMQAILLVFPICGLMVAGGNYVSKLLLASGFGDGGIVNAITAMLAGIVPIFFIPSVLRGSMNGLAGIGGKISSFGRSLGARGSNAVRNNKAYQERMQYEKNKVDVGRARRIQRALSRKENLNERQKNKLRMAQEAVAADENRKLRDRFGSTQESFDSRIKNQEAAFSNEREKMFTETFGRMTDRNDIVKELEQALDGEDSERASAALASLIERGGTKEALEALEYRKVRDANGNVSNVRRNWSDMNGDVRNRLLQKMGSTNVDAMKSFAKYRNTGGNASFGDWYSGIGDARDSESVKDRTYAQHLLDNGFKAMGGYSKDEIEYVERHLSDIQNTMAAQGKAGELAGMITNAALYSKDAKVQTVAERMIEGGQIGIRDMGLTADMIGSMRGDTAAAMRKGIEAQIRSSNAARGITMTDQQIEDQARTILRTTLAPQIKAIESDRRILNRTADGTRAELGIGQVDINPQSGAENNAAQNDGSGNLVPDQTMYSRGNSGQSSETAAPTGTVIYDAATGQTVQPYKGPTQPTQPQWSSSQTAPTGTVIYDAATGQTTPPYRNPNNTNNRPNREPSQSGDINIPRGEDNDDDINYVG